MDHQYDGGDPLIDREIMYSISYNSRTWIYTYLRIPYAVISVTVFFRKVREEIWVSHRVKVKTPRCDEALVENAQIVNA